VHYEINNLTKEAGFLESVEAAFFTDILLVERDLDTYTFLTMSLSLL